MSGHPAESGPSAQSDAANPAGTGYSEATASFIAANGSPFISPMDMIPSGVKVPDPRVTDRTCSATLTARFSSQVIADGTNGKLLVIVDCDPLSQLPVWISRQHKEQSPGETVYGQTAGSNADIYYYNEPTLAGTTTSDRCDPRSWGQTYDVLGMADLFSQTKTLADQSSRYRIVGCGVRANIGVDTAISRGTIEAGQFNWSDTKNTRTSTVAWGFLAGASGAAPTARKGYWSPDCSGGGAKFMVSEQIGAHSQKGMCTLMHSNAYTLGKNAIRSARTQNYGVLDGDQGASVRWTDTHNFKFMRTINKNCLSPNKNFYSNGYDCSRLNAFEEESTYPVNTIDCNATRLLNADATTYPGKLSTTITESPLVVHQRPHVGYSINDSQFWTADSTAYDYYAAETDGLINLSSGSYTEQSSATTTYQVGDGTLADLGVITFEEHFDKGLYIDITGVNTGQWVNVDVVWHVEYIPRAYSLDTGLASPVDVNFDTVAAMLNDSRKFPIVVKGHSFFSSLWAGVKRAFGKGREIIGAAGPMLSMLPSPHARAAGMAMSAASGMLDTAEQTYKRIRYA